MASLATFLLGSAEKKHVAVDKGLDAIFHSAVSYIYSELLASLFMTLAGRHVQQRRRSISFDAAKSEHLL